MDTKHIYFILFFIFACKSIPCKSMDLIPKKKEFDFDKLTQNGKYFTHTISLALKASRQKSKQPNGSLANYLKTNGIETVHLISQFEDHKNQIEYGELILDGTFLVQHGSSAVLHIAGTEELIRAMPKHPEPKNSTGAFQTNPYYAKYFAVSALSVMATLGMQKAFHYFFR